MAKKITLHFIVISPNFSDTEGIRLLGSRFVQFLNFPFLFSIFTKSFKNFLQQDGSGSLSALNNYLIPQTVLLSQDFFKI
ncbi:MAG: hypothetical protein V7767_09020 [Leeuwenhoekiella sp.]